MAIKENAVVLTTAGKSQEIPSTKGTVLLGSNIFYMFQFVLGRYDVAKGGVQQVPVFPNINARIERVARDEAQPAGLVAGAQKSAFDRYTVTLGLSSFVAWVDMKGRIAVLAMPIQKFNAVLEEYRDYAQGLNAALASTTKETEPDYSAPPEAPFSAEEVTAQAKGFTLSGTLLLPKTGKRPFPAVITITGSGQQTRDEALPIPGLENYRPFRQVAETLAARGIAVLRVDDRGVGKSKGAETLSKASSFDFADDVRAQVEYLRKRAEIDPNRIALVGHSEGGIIAPIVASSDSKIAAIVLMAGTAKPGTAVLQDQMRDLLERDPTVTAEERAKRMAEQQSALNAVLEGRDDPNVPAQMRNAWMKEFLRHDPLQTIVKVRQPVLILQGALDRQVTADQAALLDEAARKAGNRDVTTRVYATLNHLFLPSATGAFSEYSSLSTTSVPPEVLNDLANWLAQKLGVK
jgi:dienelactone hydrolase